MAHDQHLRCWYCDNQSTCTYRIPPIWAFNEGLRTLKSGTRYTRTDMLRTTRLRNNYDDNWAPKRWPREVRARVRFIRRLQATWAMAD